MYRSLILASLLLAAGPARLASAQTDAPAQTAPTTAAANGLPARPTPFQFVNDQAGLMAPAEVRKLEGGLRRYADQTGTQVVVVTVPTLGGRTAADYGRALGTAWEVGQRDKNNGVVVVVAAKEHKVAIESGSGLRDKITPAVTQRVIGQDFSPNFKKGDYFTGLRKGLSQLMLAADPSTDPRKNAAGTTAGAAGTADATGAAGAAGAALSTDGPRPAQQEPVASGGGGITTPVAPPASSGPGMGTLLLGALGIGGLIFLLTRLFRRSSTPGSTAGGAPNFNPNQPYPNQNQPNRPGGGSPNFLPNQPQGGNYGPGYNSAGPGMMGGGGLMGGSGPGIGGMLATGAAAAAGAYLGNRMAGGHDVSGNGLGGQQEAGFGGMGAGAAGLGGGLAGAGTAAAGDDYFSNRDGGGAGNTSEPDYFADDASSAGGSGDYFSSDDDGGSSSYDDTSSGDTGGGGFDGGGGDDSGSW